MNLVARILDGLLPPCPEVGGAAAPAPIPPEGSPQPPVGERTAMAPPPDVATALDARAMRLGVGAGWRASLEDLLQLLQADGPPISPDALAVELHLSDDVRHALDRDAALHMALLQRLSENGAVTSQNFYA